MKIVGILFLILASSLFANRDLGRLSSMAEEIGSNPRNQFVKDLLLRQIAVIEGLRRLEGRDEGGANLLRATMRQLDRDIFRALESLRQYREEYREIRGLPESGPPEERESREAWETVIRGRPREQPRPQQPQPSREVRMTGISPSERLVWPMRQSQQPPQQMPSFQPDAPRDSSGYDAMRQSVSDAVRQSTAAAESYYRSEASRAYFGSSNFPGACSF